MTEMARSTKSARRTMSSVVTAWMTGTAREDRPGAGGALSERSATQPIADRNPSTARPLPRCHACATGGLDLGDANRADAARDDDVGSIDRTHRAGRWPG